MNFDFDDDQKSLQHEVRRFLAAEYPLSCVHTILNDPSHSYDSKLWQSMNTQGWLGATVPEEYGGLSLGLLELCLMAEEIGRALLPVPFASTLYILAEAVKLAGTAEQKQAILPRIAQGELIGALAISEGDGPLDAAVTKARVSGGQLTGVKRPVTDGGIANVALVLAASEQGPTLYLVDLDGPGVSRRTLRSIDPTRDLAELEFVGASADPIGDPGAGRALLDRILDGAAVLLAFEQLGAADRCLEMARDFTLDRYAFGRQVASYQAIKHKLADVFVQNQLARSNAYYGAWAIANEAPELPVAASAARLAASKALWLASKENIQVHGGIGFTWEMDCHLFFRRSRQLSLTIGAPPYWSERLVTQLENAIEA